MLKSVQNQDFGEEEEEIVAENGKNNNKPKSTRNNEKRRERSKVAARCRRGRESEIFSDLSSCLPLPENIRSSLDKASIARLAVTHLKLKGMMSDLFSKNGGNETAMDVDLQFDSYMNNALGGFVIVLSADGDIVYVSESITTHLGLSQCEVMGQSVHNFSHPCDHADIKELFTVNKNEKDSTSSSHYRSSFFRMKCTITSKGRSVHLRAASYKAINCTGHLYVGGNDNDESKKWFIGIGETLPDPTNVTFPLNKQAFVTRHSADMKCEDVAGNVEEFLGYKPDDLIGKSFFEFHHAADGQEIGKDFKQLFTKGQIQTQRYRFLAKYGGWAWIISQATVLKSENNSSKPNGIICLHFVTSGIENESEILSHLQVLRPVEMKREVLVDISNCSDIHVEKDSFLPVIGLSSPIPSTTKIFAPRTEDMDTGFLMPCDNKLVVSKEEPEDLTHLAPIAGDECVELNVPLLDDLLKSFDEAQIDYSKNGHFIEVESDELPLFNIEEYSKIIQNGNGDEPPVLPLGITKKQPLVVDMDSPLFLRNSDPTLCSISPDIACGGLLSPFPPQNSPTSEGISNNNSNESCGYLNESSINCYDAYINNGEMGNSCGSIGSCGSLVSPIGTSSDTIYDDPGSKEMSMNCVQDELSEFTAPYIPLDGADDFPLLSTGGDFAWPLEFHTVPMVIDKPSSNLNFQGKDLEIPPDKIQAETSFFGPKSMERPMLNEENIDKVSVAGDIASIFKDRKPGDAPKVVTKFMFSSFDPPPMKLRKIGSPPPNRKAVLTPGSKIPSNPRIETVNMQLQNRIPNFGNNFGNSNTMDEQQKLNSIRKRNLFGILLGQGGSSPLPSLCELTQQDCEVNAPLSGPSNLLQGSDLLRALEQDMDNSNDVVAVASAI